MKQYKIEWQTLGLMVACYGVWFASTFSFGFVEETYGVAAGILLLFSATALAAAFHTSLQHEVVHGHPTPSQMINEAMVSLPLILVYPFRRYRDLHLKHHVDENLTDPYDDPESYYWPYSDGLKLSKRTRFLLGLNNTLVGRLLLGPFLGLYGFYRTEWQRIVANEPGVRKAWLMHFIGMAFVLYWVIAVCGISLWAYIFVVALPAVSWILIRSFAEHQAAEEIGGRSAVVEAHPFFGLLYLNNNLHLVHHAHPTLAWYELPAFYRERKSNYLAANNSFFFKGYGEVFRRFGFTRKQPVFHPLWRLGPSPQSSENNNAE